MRKSTKFIRSAVVVIVVIVWQSLIQFTFIETIVVKLRSRGQVGVFLADLALSRKAVWSLIVVAILLILVPHTNGSIF
jgi:hypothetical protein